MRAFQLARPHPRQRFQSAPFTFLPGKLKAVIYYASVLVCSNACMLGGYRCVLIISGWLSVDMGWTNAHEDDELLTVEDMSPVQRARTPSGKHIQKTTMV